MRKRIIVKSLMLLAVFTALALTACFVPSCASVPAFAGMTTETPIGGALRQVIADTLMPLVVSLVGALVSLVLLKIKQKLNLSISGEQESWINRQAENAVQFVAEKTAAKFKVDNITFTGNEKLELAIASLITKAPKLTRDQADQYIHAAIARIPGVGATGDQSLVVGATVPLQAIASTISS